MDYVYIGKCVGTHGIKGEIRLISNFDKKDKVFLINMPIYIGNMKQKEIITGYRKHKNYDMITLEGLNNINDVLKYKGSKVYVLRSDLNLDGEYILDDLLGMKVLENNEEYGIIQNIYDNNGNTLLEVCYDRNYYIPFNNNFIKKVDLKNKCVEVLNVKDLIL